MKKSSAAQELFNVPRIVEGLGLFTFFWAPLLMIRIAMLDDRDDEMQNAKAVRGH